MKKPKHENPTHLKAFEVYLQLGEKRTIEKVAKRCKKSPSTVQVWSTSFKWKARVRKLDKRVSEKIVDDIEAYKLKVKRDNLRVIQLAKDKYERQLKKGKDVNTAEYERICRLEQLILGEATDRMEVKTVADLIADDDPEG